MGIRGCSRESIGNRVNYEGSPAQELEDHETLSETSNEDRERRGNPQTNKGRVGQIPVSSVSPLVSHLPSVLNLVLVSHGLNEQLPCPWPSTLCTLSVEHFRLPEVRVQVLLTRGKMKSGSMSFVVVVVFVVKRCAKLAAKRITPAVVSNFIRLLRSFLRSQSLTLGFLC